MRHPPDLQSAMYYARAYERRAATFLPAPQQQRSAQPPVRPGLPVAPRPAANTTAGGRGAPALPASTPAAAGQPRFRRLSPAEQQERRRQGLCFNCDEPYVRGHVCQRLFYLETNDEVPAEVAAAAVFPEAQEAAAALSLGQDAAALAQTAPAVEPKVSLHALAGVRAENAMLLPVTVHGHRVVALLDSGSTTNFINADLMRRLQLVTTPHPTLRVLVANGDRVPCQGVARDVSLAIGTEEFSISCFGISLGEFDLILGVEFL